MWLLQTGSGDILLTRSSWGSSDTSSPWGMSWTFFLSSSPGLVSSLLASPQYVPLVVAMAVSVCAHVPVTRDIKGPNGRVSVKYQSTVNRKDIAIALDLLVWSGERHLQWEQQRFWWHNTDSEHRAHDLICSRLMVRMLHRETATAALHMSAFAFNANTKSSLPFLSVVHGQVHWPHPEFLVCLSGLLARALCRGGRWPRETLVFPGLGHQSFLKFYPLTHSILQWYLADLRSDLLGISKNLNFWNMRLCPRVTGNWRSLFCL